MASLYIFCAIGRFAEILSGFGFKLCHTLLICQFNLKFCLLFCTYFMTNWLQTGFFFMPISKSYRDICFFRQSS